MQLDEDFFRRTVAFARRRFLLTFNKNYVKRSIEQRKGHCSACGICCHYGPRHY